MLKFKQIKKILLEDGGDLQLQEFAREFYHVIATASPSREIYPRDLLSKHFDCFARLIVGDGVCAAAGFDSDNNKLYIATNSNNHPNHRLSSYITMTLKQGSTDQNYLIQLYVHYSLDNGKTKRIPVDEIILYRYDEISKLMIPSQEEVSVQIIADLNQILNYMHGDCKVIFKLATVIPEIMPKFNGVLAQDLELPGKYWKIERSIDNSFIRCTETLIKLLGLHAIVAEAEQKGISSASIDMFRLESDEYRVSIFLNSIAIEATRWFKKNIKPQEYGGLQEFCLFLEELNKDFIDYKNVHLLTQISSYSVESWLREYFNKVEHDILSCPHYVTKEKEFFIKAVGRYFSDIEILESFVKNEARITGNKFMEFLKSQAQPGVKVDGLVIVNTLENNVHAEMRILWYILTDAANIPYIATSLLCCAHCNLAMTTHNIKVSG
jgi:hypothetical protein